MAPYMIFSQATDFNCGTVDSDIPPATAVAYSNFSDPNYLDSFDPIVFNVFFWGINDDDGNSTNELNETDVLNAIADLNIMYNEFNMYFKYYGFNYFNSSRFYTTYGVCSSDPK